MVVSAPSFSALTHHWSTPCPCFLALAPLLIFQTRNKLLLLGVHQVCMALKDVTGVCHGLPLVPSSIFVGASAPPLVVLWEELWWPNR